MVLELLKKAEILTERDAAGRAVTFNNLACYYRRQGKLHAALQYLQKVRRRRPGVTWWHGCDAPAAAAPRRLASPPLPPVLHITSPPTSHPPQALKIENKLDQVDNPADTYLNTCAVLSQLGRHQSALEHAQQALILLQEELSRVLGPMADGNEAPKADRIAVLAIAYHNVGVSVG